MNFCGLVHLQVYGYGLMIAIGILAAYFTGEYRAKKAETAL